ncbi:REJ domain-containing protein [Aphelenchoides besseyi]|nr:REJ domain-containing protein [Aphelenchoides besseyi]
MWVPMFVYLILHSLFLLIAAIRASKNDLTHHSNAVNRLLVDGNSTNGNLKAAIKRVHPLILDRNEQIFKITIELKNQKFNDQTECVINDGNKTTRLHFIQENGSLIVAKILNTFAYDQTIGLRCRDTNKDKTQFHFITNLHVIDISSLIRFHDDQPKQMEMRSQIRAKFSTLLSPPFSSDPFCVDELGNYNPAYVEDLNVVICNLTTRKFDNNPHLLFVVRSMELNESTLRRQRPILILPKNSAADEPNAVERNKRDVDLVSAMSASNGGKVNENLANNLLEAYDLLLSKQQTVVQSYLLNIQELLSEFCSQTIDVAQNVKAEGRDYTMIQLQNLMPNSPADEAYSIPGTTGKTFQFGTNFRNIYAKCSDNSTLCLGICLGTSRTKASALRVNQQVSNYFAPSAYNAIGMSQLTSDLYQILFIDPHNGKTIELQEGAAFTVQIPMSKYTPSDYYKCLTFINGQWISDYCTSSNYATAVKPNEFQFNCTCQAGGFIAVFSVFPPTPLYYPPYNEVNITVKLSTNNRCSANDANSFVQSLVQGTTKLEKVRFVKPKCHDGGWLSVILRPAFRENQTTNSYTMQSIKKTMLAPSGFVAFGSVKVTNVTDNVIKRNLTNDGNARRISLRIDRSFKETVGNDSGILAQNWIENMSNNMRISSFRFKSAHIAIGMMFNFTITLPFSGENAESALSAEEIAIWIREQTIYKELEILDPQDQPMPIDELNPDDIVQLVVSAPLAPLAAILAGLVTILCILSTLCVGGLVFVKLRTDRLIEKHNRLRNTDVCHTVPLPVVPYESPLMPTTLNTQEEEHLQFAADTVIFGRTQRG